MTELATGTAEAVQDTPSPADSAPTEARISPKDMDKLADKVSEAAKPKSDAERAEADAKSLEDIQRKAYRKAKEGRERENGKFAKPADENEKDAAKALSADPAPAKAEPKTVSAEKADVKDQKPVEAETKTEPSPEKPATREINQPQSWSPEKKAIWEGLSPEAKEQIAQREQEAHKVISKLGQFAKGFEPVAKTLESYKETFASKGLSFDAGVRQLLDAQRMLDRDPVTAIQEIARAYGVDFGKSLSSQRDPVIGQLQAQVDRLTQQLQDVDNERQTRIQTERHTKLQSIDKIISDFAADKPDFPDLADDVAVIVGTLHQSNPEMSYQDKLATAYDRAQWANPKTRQAMLDRKDKEAEAKRLEAAKTAQKEAERARAINVTSAVGPSGEVDIEAIQRATFRKAQNR